MIILDLEKKIRFTRRAEREYNKHFTHFLLRKSGFDHYEILISNVKTFNFCFGRMYSGWKFNRKLNILFLFLCVSLPQICKHGFHVNVLVNYFIQVVMKGFCSPSFFPSQAFSIGAP